MKDIEWGEEYGTGDFSVTCDHCGDMEIGDFEDGFPGWKEIQEELRNEGWVSGKFSGEWLDFCCEACRTAYREEN